MRREPYLCGAGLRQLFSVLFFSFACVLCEMEGDETQRGSLEGISYHLKLLLAFHHSTEMEKLTKEAVTMA